MAPVGLGLLPTAGGVWFGAPGGAYGVDSGSVVCRAVGVEEGFRFGFTTLLLTGQTSRHAPHKLEANGNCEALFNPINCGVITAPIGPG